MAIFKHPVTGVLLNDITHRRKYLIEVDAVTAFVMRMQGVSYTDIVHHLGTNANRVGEVMRGEVWKDAAAKARRLLRNDLFDRP